jgi:hypothetical protein
LRPVEDRKTENPPAATPVQRLVIWLFSFGSRELSLQESRVYSVFEMLKDLNLIFFVSIVGIDFNVPMRGCRHQPTNGFPKECDSVTHDTHRRG